ncbi:MAG: site-2 protease family protein [Phycisphaerales bacterium]|nr:site-2 protease family protein [Phycisphaerales bacterium]MCB9857635.1 site-2 protease family protein [Phycisphaerales bacterium]MCB9864808.1 site-2 protease family protein [Phycisphaerales bacterium]
MLQSLTANSDLMMAQMPAFLGNIWNVTQIILGFSLIVFVHELGHFVAAKWAGVRVETFAVGFGKELFGFTKGETRYSFNVLPLGGYVKMLGQEDFVVDKTGELKVKEDPRSFTNKSVGKRMVIVCAGVVMNLVFAAAVFTIVNMVGRTQMPAVIGIVGENDPAGRAGLQPGDRVLAINGTPIDDFNHMFSVISLSDEGEELDFKVERDGKIVEPHPRVIPEYQADSERRQIGVGKGYNYRVCWLPTRGDEKPREDELQVNDRITHVIVDGKRISLDDEGWIAMIRPLLATMGQPLKLVVQRPTHPESLTTAQLYEQRPDVESTEHVVTISPLWFPISYDPGTPQYASLLGFVPRLTAPRGLDPNEPFGKAGMQYKDVIVGIADVDFPSWPELKAAYEANAGKTIPLRIRRESAENRGLSAKAVDWLIEQREALIAGAIENFETAKARALTLVGASDLSETDRNAVAKAMEPLADLSSWRTWLDAIDVHQLSLEVPGGSLLGGSTPTIQAYLQPTDEGMVFVADTVPNFGDETTPARESTIPRSAVILKVDEQPVRAWYEFYAALRTRAGKAVTITYRHLDSIATAQMKVPDCVEAKFNLLRGDRITKIGGETETEIVSKDKNGNDSTKRVILPDWRAIAALLEKHVGKSVEVEYVRLTGERGKGEYAVTADNTDPWLDRAHCTVLVDCYPLSERHPMSNPIEAFVAGMEQAHRATIDTIITIKQMVTGNVGTKNMSGPLGIMAIGAKVADHSTLDLLWLLGLLSANLAVINFLPLPIVDGGLFLFLVLEKIRGEPVSIKVQVATQIVGIALIATVFILVTAQDLLKMM